jgi:tRNA pseudouridine38-40 synthase
VRTLDRLDVIRCGDIIEIVAEARSFLHHQVRNFVGTLILVGEGRWPIEHVATALEAKDRAAAGPTAPPHGLTLISVDYPVTPFIDPLIKTSSQKGGMPGKSRSIDRASPAM